MPYSDFNLKKVKSEFGLGQCVAEMIAAKIYNAREGKEMPCIYGAVTTGHAWKFLKLEANTAYIDIENYYIKNPRKVVGIFTYMIRQLAKPL